MINFIKWNWKNLIAIAACIAAGAALNAHVEHITQGAFNIITILFV
jgi:hypothetical protein